MNAPIQIPFSAGDLTVLGPLVAILVACAGVLVVDVVVRDERARDRWAMAVGLCGAFLAALLALLPAATASQTQVVAASLVADPLTALFDLLLAVLAVGTLLVGWRSLERASLKTVEFLGLAFLSFAGMFLMNRAGDLLTLFVAIELMSLPVYVLVAMSATTATAREAALKYFVLGSLASALLVYGMALLYGATGSVGYTDIARTIANLELLGSKVGQVGFNPLLLAGLALVLGGLAFKLAAVPFHMWTPDVYEGAPIAVTTLMAAGVKAAGSVALVRFLASAVALDYARWVGLVWWLAALSMFVGNVGALRQQNLKRLLAYSSIAHAGYLLLGMLQPGTGAAAASFYAFLYGLSVLGAFGALQWMASRQREPMVIDDLNGLAHARPWEAVALTIFLLSLAGIPPTGGFAAKFLVLGAAVQSGFWGLALFGVITSLVGVTYYLKPVMAMWMVRPAEGATAATVSDPAAAWTVAVLALAVLFFGCFPGWLWTLAAAAATALG